MAADVLKLTDLRPEEVPALLRAESYFDFQAHPFEHQALFEQTSSVYGAILAIEDYATRWLAETIAARKAERSDLTCLRASDVGGAATIGHCEVLLEPGALFLPARIIGGKPGSTGTIYVESEASVVGSDLYVAKGSVFIGSGTTIEPGVGIKGPTIIGQNCEIRQGAYLRGNCIVGNDAVLRGELKNVVLMDKANFPHPSYLGDSVCGYMTHFGNQATAANLGIYEGLRERDQRKNLVLKAGDKAYDLGKPKMGICMGDFSQIGCNSVSDPGTFVGPYTIAYQLTRLTRGFYGPNEVLKNKPLEHGVIERVPFKPLQ